MRGKANYRLLLLSFVLMSALLISGLNSCSSDDKDAKKQSGKQKNTDSAEVKPAEQSGTIYNFGNYIYFFKDFGAFENSGSVGQEYAIALSAFRGKHPELRLVSQAGTGTFVNGSKIIGPNFIVTFEPVK